MRVRPDIQAEFEDYVLDLVRAIIQEVSDLG